MLELEYRFLSLRVQRRMSILKLEINAFICGKPVLVLLLFFKDIIELINQFYFGCAGFVAVLALFLFFFLGHF